MLWWGVHVVGVGGGRWNGIYSACCFRVVINFPQIVFLVVVYGTEFDMLTTGSDGEKVRMLLNAVYFNNDVQIEVPPPWFPQNRVMYKLKRTALLGENVYYIAYRRVANGPIWVERTVVLIDPDIPGPSAIRGPSEYDGRFSGPDSTSRELERFPDGPM